MKTLVVMRHGKALPPVEGQADEERTLSADGIRALDARLHYMTGLLETGGKAARIWASPALRALQTAEILEAALASRNVDIAEEVEAHDSLWRQDVDAFLAELDESDAEAVFAVGHVPFVETIVERLVGSTPPFSTGALACLEVGSADDRAKSRLLWFAQGPVAGNWKTLTQMQEAITFTAEAIERQRTSFFVDPDDIENIHHFRTKIRSLRSLLAFIKPWQDKKQNTETQDILREIVRHTSRLRELDVFEKQVRSNPDASRKLLKFCKRQAAAERKQVFKYLESKDVTRAFERAMHLAKHVAWKKRYLEHGLPAEVVRARFDDLIETTTAELETLRLADEERTHDVRKNAKRARYVSDLFSPVLGDDAKAIAKGMTAHQDNLGDVCDARVNIALINEFLLHDLPEIVVWELNLLRAQNEAFLFGVLMADA